MDIRIDNKAIIKKTLSDQIYDILYKLITEGEIKPGDELTERELAKIFNVSRTPIREAFSRLKAEGLIEGNNYSRVTVRMITKEDIEEVFELRCLLEICSIEKVIENCTDDDIMKLEDILSKTYEDVINEDMEAIIEDNTLFHGTLNNISNKKRVIQLLNNLGDIILIHRKYGIKSKEFAMKIYESHKTLLEAIKKKDKAKAIETIKKHMFESQEATLKGFEQIFKD